MAADGTQSSLKAGTAWQTSADFNRRLLSALLEGDKEREVIAAKVIRSDSGDEFWDRVQRGQQALGVGQLARVLQGMEQKDHRLYAAKVAGTGNKTLFGQQAFYDAMARNVLTAEKIRDGLLALQAEGKKNKGYVSSIFNVFSHRNPVEKAMESVAELERYTRRQGIVYDEAAQNLVSGEKPKTAMDRIWDFRFLAAAGAGGAVGLGGLNLAAAAPSLGLVTGAFFGGLPYLALPFITLSIFRAFSEKSLLKEAGTLGRFAGVMTAGFAISFGVVSAMSGFLPVLDPASIASEGSNFITSMTGGGFNPSKYILHGIGAGAVMGGLYRAAKLKMADGFRQGADAAGGRLQKAFNAVSNVVVNRRTAPVIKTLGAIGEKAGHAVDKGFGHYMNWVGVPAVVIMMSGTLSAGLGGLAAYGAYYATVMTGMAVTTLGLAGLARFRYGLGKKGFASLSKIASTAFGTSSSAATMPVTKSGLREIGVPEHITNSVVPLGANFNMLGTSLYLGSTAAVAIAMFGMPLTLPLLATVAAVTVLTAFGAPGMPSSNIILLDPVLQKTGLDPAQSDKIYKMVMPMDRIFDMSQTVLNVMGDALVALDVWRGEKKKAAAGMEGKTWGQRLKAKLGARNRKGPPSAPAAPQPRL